ncbi:hypothetical protein BKA63DRAFT_456828 [Paraphoma chrysanthemicola]|nr:hypothetical protein BKA63DRAFT_456828 [Paraphoma chrysanthemicola]
MSLFKIGSPLRLAQCVGRTWPQTVLRSDLVRLQRFSQPRYQHNRTPNTRQTPGRPVPVRSGKSVKSTPIKEDIPSEQYAFPSELSSNPRIVVRYFRPAIWAIVVSGGIFASLAFLQAKSELKPKTPSWPSAPQWGTTRRTPPSPTELATQTWASLNPMSKLSAGIIATNSVVHLTSFVVPAYWQSLWHMPARNVNYTLFTSMFVHSGPFHLFVNMYFTYNFMIPVGYSRAFEGNPYQVGAFFLATGVLSGYAQHLATLISPQKRAIPEIFIRCGGASGALLGMLGVFCMQYPNAGLGIMFVPVHFDAQYVLPAIMLFDFIGMVRGYSFVNFGHAAHLSGALLGVAYSTLDGNNKLWKPLVRFWKQQLQH